MSVVGNQQQTLLRLLAALRPHWRADAALPNRIQSLLARERKFGSRDRRLYRELIYTTLRYLPWIEASLETDTVRALKRIAWLAAKTRDTAAFKAEVSGDWPDLNRLAERATFLDEALPILLPEWTQVECPIVLEPLELESQLARAPLWLRLQTDDAEAVRAEFAAAGWRWTESPALNGAWRMREEVDVTKSKAYARGAIEIQDLGSQFVLASIGIRPGERWLDACAGAGGKTLQLARLVGPDGHVDAHDVRSGALDELTARAARAGATNVAIVASPRDEYDGVLVDAPCTGSGTWRRAPHLKWITTAEAVAEKAALQRSLLHQFSRNVRAGGRLVYATCSLAQSENERVIAAFLADMPAFQPEAPAQTYGYAANDLGMTMLPSRHDTDGFFVSVLRRA